MDPIVNVAFKPAKSLNPISERVGEHRDEGEALAPDLGFDTWTVREQGAP